jgi:hypothetical protein
MVAAIAAVAGFAAALEIPQIVRIRAHSKRLWPQPALSLVQEDREVIEAAKNMPKEGTMSFEAFLNEFKGKYQDPKVAFDYVFGSQRKELDKYRPTLAEADAFIEFLRAAILFEKKKYVNRSCCRTRQDTLL